MPGKEDCVLSLYPGYETALRELKRCEADVQMLRADNEALRERAAALEGELREKMGALGALGDDLGRWTKALGAMVDETRAALGEAS